MNYELRAEKRCLVVLVFSVVLLSQAGSAGAFGEVCAERSECPGSGAECCCCNVNAAGACTSPSEGVCGNKNCTNIVCPFSKHTSLSDLINGVVNWVFNIGIVLCPLMIVIGAFLFMTSAGEPKRTQWGKDILKWSVIGLAIILFARGIEGIIRFILVGQ